MWCKWHSIHYLLEYLRITIFIPFWGQTELMYLAISNKDSTLTLAEWKRVINESIEEQTSNETTSSSSEEGFTITKLIEEKLSGIVTSEEAKRITATLNGLRNHASSAESNAAMVNSKVQKIDQMDPN